MVVKVLSGLGVLVAGFLLYVFLQPSNFEITRQVSIQATAEDVFPYFNNPKKMDEWNPWLENDPQIKMTYSGPEQGVDAKVSWESKGDMGVGSATIVDSVENTLVRTKLEYVQPFEISQMAELSIDNSGEAVVVTWKVKGENNFIGRIFCTLMNMDEEIGSTFDKGLNKLKTMVEQQKAS